MINMGLKTAITLINVQHMEGGGRGQGPPGSGDDQLKLTQIRSLILIPLSRILKILEICFVSPD